MADDIRDELDIATTTLLQEAYTFTGPSADVDTIWLYMSSQDGGIFAEPVFSIAGHVCQAFQVDNFLASPVDAVNTHGTLVEIFADTAFELSLKFEDVKQDEPTRIITRYDVANQTVNATFRYEPIEHDEDNETWADVFNRWVERLEQTGDDTP